MYVILVISALFAVVAIALAIYGGKIDKTLDATSLYRVAASLVVASIISGIVSFFAISYALSESSPSGMSTQNAIVDILGVLVTVLMGWNIISLVDFKKKADEINYIKQDFKNVIGGFMQLNFDSFLMIGDKPTLLDNCFKALDEIHTCLNESVREMAVGKLMDLIKQVCDNMTNSGNELILPDKKNIYLYTLNHIDSKYVEDIKAFLNRATYTGQQYASDDQGGAQGNIVSGESTNPSN